MPYGSSPGMVIACGGVRRRARRPVWSGACGIAGRRIACRRACRDIAYRHIAVRFGDIRVSAVPTVGHPEGPSSAMPRPNTRLSPTPPTAVLRVVSHVNTEAFYRRPSGGAAKADRWAVLTPTCGCRTVRAVGEIAHHHVSLGIIGHHRIRTYAVGLTCGKMRR